jgi:siroheme synthase
MGLARSVAIACCLIEHGWSRGTPAAVIVDASTHRQQVWRGTLDQLAADPIAIDEAGAGTIVVGDVVAVGLQDVVREHDQCAAGERRPFSRV